MGRFLKTAAAGYVDISCAILIMPMTQKCFRAHMASTDLTYAVIDLPDDQTFEDVAKDWMALREAVYPAHLPLVEMVGQAPMVEDPAISTLLLQNRQHRIDELIAECRRYNMAVPATSGDRVKTTDDAERIIQQLEQRLEDRLAKGSTS